jgi:hypothetical protein
MIGNKMKDKFVTKDSGKKQNWKSGMRRDIQEDKPRYDLIYYPFLFDWAMLMKRGAEKYGERNWEKANSIEEMNRFKASAWRHFIQYMNGEEDEAHHVAVAFNLAGIEMLKKKLKIDINGNKI